jgi:hypothetical protein
LTASILNSSVYTTLLVIDTFPLFLGHYKVSSEMMAIHETISFGSALTQSLLFSNWVKVLDIGDEKSSE